MAPSGIKPLLAFPPLLREHGFPVAPDQTIGFLEAVGVLGPRGMADIRRSALALFAIPKDREIEFDFLFDAHFLDRTLAAPSFGGDDDEVFEVREDRGGDIEAEERDGAEASGLAATGQERLGHRRFERRDGDQILAGFGRRAPSLLPSRKSYRFAQDRRGRSIDFRKTLRDAMKSGGETDRWATRSRKKRLRRIVLLIDVSGSMKERTELILRFAHSLAAAANRFEAFTFGTRLTRITRALQLRDRDRALSRIGSLVADIDGGTRLGASLEAFIDTPRFSGFASGALAIVVSDGLERGSPERMVEAVRRFSRKAWRLYWLTPLADGGSYMPETEALKRCLPYLDGVGEGGSLEGLTESVLELASFR